jgi:hypothetical protein
MAFDPTKQTVSPGYDLSWGSSPTDLGGVDDVKINLPINLQAKTAPNNIAPGLVIGHKAMGIKGDGTVVATMTETTLAQLKALCPWMTGTNEWIPVIGADLDSYAQNLIIFPKKAPHKLKLYKAAPSPDYITVAGTGGHDTYVVTFYIYPDATKYNSATPLAAYGELMAVGA